jgi:hypothetical protein
VTGKPLPQRVTLGPVELDRYLAGQLQGLAYMRRLRAIEDEEALHLGELEETWRALADEEQEEAAFAAAWRDLASTWNFSRINALIAKHNAYYAIEARVAMSPRTGGYARSWHRGDYTAEWILERFPAVRALALEASGSEPQTREKRPEPRPRESQTRPGEPETPLRRTEA